MNTDITIENWPLQDIFDFCCAHLAQQKRPAVSEGRCLYRTPDGCRCAYGAFIPDAEMRPEFDRGIKPVSDLVAEYGYIAPAFRVAPGVWASPEHARLAKALQNVHDDCNADGPDQMRASLREAAVGLGLNTAAVRQITEWSRA